MFRKIQFFLRKLVYVSFREVEIYVSTLIFRFKLIYFGMNAGKGLRVRGNVKLFVAPGGILRIGDKVRLNSGFANNPVGGHRNLIIWVGKNGVLHIGNEVGISSSTLVAMESITIGDSTIIGGDTSIYDTDFHPLFYTDRVTKRTAAITAPVTLKNGCFIGGHVIVLKGATIGETQ